MYDLNNQPGPGAYDNKPTTAPAPVFGKAARAGRTGTEEVPAPWSYNIPDF